MKLLKSLSVYTFASFLQQGINFLLLPILTFYLANDQMGELSLCLSYVSMLSIIFNIGIHGSVQVEYFKKERAELPSYFSSAYSIPLILFFLILAFTSPFTVQLAKLADIPPIWVPGIIILSFMMVIFNATLNIYRVQQKAIAYSIYNISFTITNLLISLFFVVMMKWHWEGRLGGILSSYFLFALIGLILLSKMGLFSKNIKKEHWKTALLFGLPLIPHLLGSNVMNYSDKIFISQMVNKSELGNYEVGYKIGSIILVLVSAFTTAFIPFLYDILKKPDTYRLIKVVRVSYAFLIGLFISVLGLTLFSPLLFKYVIGESYASAVQYVFWVGLSYFFWGAYAIFSGYIYFFKKTYLLSYVALMNILLNLVLNYFCIKHYGALGAAYATVISYFVCFFVIAMISHRLYPMPWFSKAVYQNIFKDMKKDQIFK